MPQYTKTSWVDGTAPAVSAANLNKIEQGVFDSIRQDGSTTMSAQLVTIAGSAATPAIAPTEDTNTGIFFPAADTIAFGEGGTEVMRITSGGNLLIGTTTDYTSTEKAGSVTIDGIGTRNIILTTGLSNSLQNVGFVIQNSTPFNGGNGATTNGILGFFCSPVISNDGSGGTNQIFSQGASVAPVLSSSSASARIWLFGGAFSATRGSANDFSTNASNQLIGNQSSANHSITLPTTAVTNLAVGFIGQSNNFSGTMTTSTAIRAVSNVAAVNTSQISTSTNLSSFESAISVGSATGGTGTVTNAYGYRISSISIGNTGTITNLYGLHIPTPTITGAGVLTNKWAIYTTDANMPSSHAGYFLIGYTASNGAYPLQVNGQIFATSSTIATSDGRYKENVVALSGALDIVKALNPVQFNWKKHESHNFDTSVPTVGFIAQEVAEVLKDKPYLNSLVKKSECTWKVETGEFVEKEVQKQIDNEEGTIEFKTEIVQESVKETRTEEFLGIAESNLIAILTKAVQELNAKVEALEAQLNK